MGQADADPSALYMSLFAAAPSTVPAAASPAPPPANAAPPSPPVPTSSAPMTGDPDTMPPPGDPDTTPPSDSTTEDGMDGAAAANDAGMPDPSALFDDDSWWTNADGNDASDTPAVPDDSHSDIPTYTPSDISIPPSLPVDVPQDVGGAVGNETAGATNTASTSPNDTAPAVQITGGTYHHHYTQSGENSYASFYTDVTIDSTFGPVTDPITGVTSSSGERGTITYTAWLEMAGEYIYDAENVVVPFSSPIVFSSDFALQGLPPGGGSISGFAAPNFGAGFMDWDHQHYSESTTFDVTGAYRAVNGADYQFANHSASNYWWDTTQTWTPAASDGGDGGDDPMPDGESGGTQTVTNKWGGDYRTDVTRSDNSANFSTDTPQLGDDGRPTDLRNAPADGTVFLERSFDRGSYKGDSTTTTVTGIGGIVTQQTVKGHSDYDGTDGYRYYFHNSTDVSNPDSADRDRLSFDINYQSQDDYGGSQDIDLTNPDGLLSKFGSATTEQHNNSTILANRYAVTDAYHRDSNGVVQDGTSRFSADDNGKPASYDNEATWQVKYNEGVRTLDKLTYHYQNNSDIKVSQSDSATFTVNVSGDDSVPAGQTTGSRYMQSSSTFHRDSDLAGAVNRLDNSGSLDNVSNYNASNSLLSFNKASYAATDGSTQWSVVSFASGGGTASGTSSADGDYNSDGAQTDGSSYDHSESKGWGSGFVWWQQAGTNVPMQTALFTSSGKSSSDATADLEYNSDGTANGTVNANSSDSSDDDTLVTTKGTAKFSDGAAQFNDYDHRHNYSANSMAVDVTLRGDQPSGTVVVEADNSVASDYKVDRQIDRDNDLLHAKIDAKGDGQVETFDTVTTTLADGTPTTTRATRFTQISGGDSDMTAKGKIDDGKGLTGEWDYTAHADNYVHDTITIQTTLGDSGPIETGRQFDIDHESNSKSVYNQKDSSSQEPSNLFDDEDDPDDPNNPEADVGRSWWHKLYVSTASHEKTLEKGTPDNYTFTFERSGYQGRLEASKSAWASLATGEGSDVRRYDDVFQSFHNNLTGTEVNGQRNLSVRDIDNRVGSDNWLRTVSSSRGNESTTTQSRISLYHQWLNGSTASGDGGRKTFLWSALWGTQTDGLGSTTSWGNEKPQPQVDKFEDLSWPGQHNSWDETIERNEILQWLASNGGYVLQISFGLFDVVSGAVMTLGSCGGAVLPGVGLMAVGVDQIVTGATNWNSGQSGQSVFEFLGSSAASGLGASEGTAQMIGAFTPAVLSLGFQAWGGLTACFAAGTPLLTPDGEKAIEQFRVGDWVLSAPECDPKAPPEPRQVEEVFTNFVPLLHVRVNGRTIRTTAEHPFYVREKGWTAAKELQAGDLLRSHDGQWVAVESVTEGEELAAVYNLRIAEHHTYFVGSRDWEFSVWAHNACVYEATNEAGTKRYVGAAGTRASDTVASRLAKAEAKEAGLIARVIPGTESFTKLEAFQLEQASIKHFGREGIDFGGTLLNIKRGQFISPNNMREGFRLLVELAINSMV
ncbi:MAG TPA: Hint domain-containing protein [Gemmataceae bacterium]